jgi:hypothetical protein
VLTARLDESLQPSVPMEVAPAGQADDKVLLGQRACQKLSRTGIGAVFRVWHETDWDLPEDFTKLVVGSTVATHGTYFVLNGWRKLTICFGESDDATAEFVPCIQRNRESNVDVHLGCSQVDTQTLFANRLQRVNSSDSRLLSNGSPRLNKSMLSMEAWLEMRIRMHSNISG